jgi:hypothetical protein
MRTQTDPMGHASDTPKALSAFQGNLIAGELLDQARQERDEQKNAKAKRVPFLFRMPELAPLQPRERSQHIAAAVRAVNGQVIPLLACSAWIGVCFAGAWATGRVPPFSRATSAWLFVLSAAPLHVIRAAFVRSILRKTLARTSS